MLLVSFIVQILGAPSGVQSWVCWVVQVLEVKRKGRSFFSVQHWPVTVPNAHHRFASLKNSHVTCFFRLCQNVSLISAFIWPQIVCRQMPTHTSQGETKLRLMASFIKETSLRGEVHVRVCARVCVCGGGIREEWQQPECSLLKVPKHQHVIR